LTLLLVFLTLASALRLVRRGRGSLALALVAMSFVPFVAVFVQGYGNDAPLRLLLFAFPAWAIVIAMGLATITGRQRRRALAVVLCAVLTPLLLQAYYGAAEINIVPAADINASSYFYSHAPSGSVLISAAPNFPGRVGARYAEMTGPQLDDQSHGTLLGTPGFRQHHLLGADVGAVVRILRQYSGTGFVVFADSGYRFAELTGLTSRPTLKRLERAIASSPQFETWYRHQGDRIYRLRDRAGSQEATG
jgi:hypothetical protein